MSSLLCQSKLFLQRNAPTILTCLGGVGVVVTSITAAKATPKALKALEKAENEKGDKLTKMEKVKAAGPAYIPAIIAGTSTISCIFGANILNKHHQASLMSAYSLLNESYKEYKNKLKELYGEEAHQRIVDALAVEKTEDMVIRSEYLCSGCDLSLDKHCGDPVVFYDEFGDRYFEATIEQVLTAEYHLNRNYILRGFAVLNELYDFLGLEPTDYGSVVGWEPVDDGMYWIEFNHRKVINDDGSEVYILEMPFEPAVGYGDY